MLEGTNGEKDEEQAKRVHERGCEAAEGPFQSPHPRRKNLEADEEVRRFSETEGARTGHWLRSSAVGIGRLPDATTAAWLSRFCIQTGRGFFVQRLLKSQAS